MFLWDISNTTSELQKWIIQNEGSEHLHTPSQWLGSRCEQSDRHSELCLDATRKIELKSTCQIFRQHTSSVRYRLLSAENWDNGTIYSFSTTYCPIQKHLSSFRTRIVAFRQFHYGSGSTSYRRFNRIPIHESSHEPRFWQKPVKRATTLSEIHFSYCVVFRFISGFQISQFLQVIWIQLLCSRDNYFPHKVLQSDRSMKDKRTNKFWNSMIPTLSDNLWVLTLICNVTRSWIRLVRVCDPLQGISTRYLRSRIPSEGHCHRFAIRFWTIMDRWNCSVEEDSAQFAWGGYSEYGHSWNCIVKGTSSPQHC